MNVSLSLGGKNNISVNIYASEYVQSFFFVFLLYYYPRRVILGNWKYFKT